MGGCSPQTSPCPFFFSFFSDHPPRRARTAGGVGRGARTAGYCKGKCLPFPGSPTRALTHTNGGPPPPPKKTKLGGGGLGGWARRDGCRAAPKKKKQPPGPSLNHACRPRHPRRLPGPGPGRHLRVRRARDGQGGGPGLRRQGERGRAWWAKLSSDWSARARASGLIIWSSPGPPARGRPPPPTRPRPPRAHVIHSIYLRTPPRQEFDAAIDAKVSDH